MKTHTRILAVGAADYALGMVWHSPRKGAGLRSECARVARQHKASHVILGKRQFALADTAGQEYQPSAARPCYSAALATASALRQATLFAAFALIGGTYIIARVNGRFLPDGDLFFEDDAEARDFFERYSHTPEWPTAARYAPAHWQVQGTQEAALDDILAEAPATLLLSKPPIRRRLVVVAVVAVLAAVGVAAAVNADGRHKPPPTRPKGAYEPLPETVAPLREMASACVEGAGKLHQTVWVPGWPLSRWQCDGASINATLTRAPKAPRTWGTAHPCVTVADDLESGTCTVEVARRETMQPLDLEDLDRQGVMERRVRIVAGTLEAGISFSVAPPRVIGGGDPPADPPRWLRMNWTLTTSAPPEYWMPPLSELKATVLGSITQDTKMTTVTGTSYVRR